MKHTCDLIGDLLPLYQEGLASAESAAIVEEHIAECSACAAEMEALQQETPAVDTAALPLARVQSGIKRRRRLSVALAACLLLALAAAFGAYASDRQYISWQEGLLTFTQEEGALKMAIHREGVYADICKAQCPDNPDALRHEVSLYSRRFDVGGGQASLLLDAPGEREASVYYVKAGEPSVLVFGRELYPDGGYVILPRLALAYYTTMALAAAAVLGLLLLVFRKKPALRIMLLTLLGLPLSYLGGHLLVKGFGTLSHYSLIRDLGWILVCAAFLFAAWLVNLRWLTLKKS
jgi:hypothetical protein